MREEEIVASSAAKRIDQKTMKRALRGFLLTALSVLMLAVLWGCSDDPSKNPGENPDILTGEPAETVDYAAEILKIK